MQELGLAVLIFFFLTGCVARPESPSLDSLKQQIQHAGDARARAEGMEPWTLVSTRVSAVAGAADEYVAIADSNPGWWGDWCWFRVRQGRIAEIVWGDQLEQSMHRLAAFRDARFPGALVVGYGMTHQGNGRYYLFHVNCGMVRTLIETRAVDVHTSDGLVLDGEALEAAYTDYDGDGWGDVVLTGREHLLTPEELDEPPEKCDWIPRKPQVIRKVFAWRPAAGRFERLWAAEIGAYEFY